MQNPFGTSQFQSYSDANIYLQCMYVILQEDGVSIHF